MKIGLKKEALRQLDEIHNSLVDSEKFRPYNYNAIIIWGLISIMLFIFAKPMFELGMVYGGVFLIALLLFGSIVEFFYIVNENKKYEIHNITPLQNFIFHIFSFSIFFGICISILLVLKDVIAYLPLLWMFIIGLPKFVTGFSVNNNLLKKFGKLNISVSILFSIVTIVFGSNEQMFMINTIIGVAIMGFGHIYIGIKLKKQTLIRG